MRAWILGGSSGLGLELAREASRLDIEVLVFGRNSYYGVDLVDRSSTEALCKKIEGMESENIKRADFFIWNASILEYAPFEMMSKLDEILDVNIRNPQKILQYFIRRKKILSSPFHLVTVSSVASWKARRDLAVYSATKAAQAQFSLCLSRELEDDLPGSKVTVVHPTGMKTNILKESSVDLSNFLEPKAVAKIIWSRVLSQKNQCNWFNILRKNGRPFTEEKSFYPELAYEDLPGYNRVSSKEEQK